MNIHKSILFLLIFIISATFMSSDKTMSKNEPIAKTGLAQATTSQLYYPATASLPALDSFINSVMNGKATQVVGVYVPGTLALPTVQQPATQPNFVSREPETTTQFLAASRFQTIGFLAHNYLAGTHFFDLKMFQTVIVIYGNGKLGYYQIVDIQKYQALTPNSPHSDFVDLNGPVNNHLTAGDLFDRVYAKGDRVIFQTCILNNGEPSWGRMFIIATPMRLDTNLSISPSRSHFLNVF